jgi:NTP pyrophosphatase (non-canonical NTP hydrolase)
MILPPPPLDQNLLTQFQKINDFFARTYPNMPEDVKILARLSKITEEVGELTNEIHGKLGFHKASAHKSSSPENLAKEWADVFNTVILMGIALDLDMNRIINNRMKDILKRYQLE